MKRLDWFKTLPLPRVFGNPTHQVINIDETGFYLKSISAKDGRSYTASRVCYPAHYIRADKNVILAIEPGDPRLPPHVDGSLQNPRQWIHVSQLNCN